MARLMLPGNWAVSQHKCLPGQSCGLRLNIAAVVHVVLAATVNVEVDLVFLVSLAVHVALAVKYCCC